VSNISEKPEFNDIPPCNIRVDKEGKWYHTIWGTELIHKPMRLFLFSLLERDEKGRYILRLKNQRCYLEVEDTPFVVMRVDKTHTFLITLNDETKEELDLNTLWVGDENVLYCKIREGKFEARFSRPAYYQLANYVEFDESQEKFYIVLNNHRYFIKYN